MWIYESILCSWGRQAEDRTATWDICSTSQCIREMKDLTCPLWFLAAVQMAVRLHGKKLPSHKDEMFYHKMCSIKACP